MRGYGWDYVENSRLEPTPTRWPTTHATRAKKSLFQNLRNGRKLQVPVSVTLPAWFPVDEIVADPLSSFSILMSGVSMITRSKCVNINRWAPSLIPSLHLHRQFVWSALAIALTAYTGQHPIRMKEGGNGISPLL
jgi:hypothetical protein